MNFDEEGIIAVLCGITLIPWAQSYFEAAVKMQREEQDRKTREKLGPMLSSKTLSEELLFSKPRKGKSKRLQKMERQRRMGII